MGSGGVGGRGGGEGWGAEGWGAEGGALKRFFKITDRGEEAIGMKKGVTRLERRIQDLRVVFKKRGGGRFFCGEIETQIQ